MPKEIVFIWKFPCCGSESTFRVHAIAAVEVTADDEFVTNDAMEAVTTKVEANPSFLRYAALKRRQKCARVRVKERCYFGILIFLSLHEGNELSDFESIALLTRC